MYSLILAINILPLFDLSLIVQHVLQVLVLGPPLADVYLGQVDVISRHDVELVSVEHVQTLYAGL